MDEWSTPARAAVSTKRWTPASPGNRIDSGFDYTVVTALAVDPHAPCHIVAGTDAGSLGDFLIPNTDQILRASVDCGATWGRPTGAPSGRVVRDLAFTTGNPASLSVSFQGNVFLCSSCPHSFGQVVRLSGGVSEFSLGTPGTSTLREIRPSHAGCIPSSTTALCAKTSIAEHRTGLPLAPRSLD